MSTLFTNMKTSSTRLARSITAGHPIFKTVGVALAIIIGLYFLFKVFG